MLRYYLSLVFLVLVSSQGLRPFGVQPAAGGPPACTNTATFQEKLGMAQHTGTSFSAALPNTISATTANTVAVVLLEYDGSGASTPTCTLNSSSMTIAGTPAHDGTHNLNAAIYTLLNPGTGTATLACTGTSVSEYYYGAFTVNKVSSSTPIRSGSYITNNALAITVTTDSQDLAVNGIESSGNISGAPPAPEDFSTAGTYSAGQALQGTAGTTSDTFTWTGSGTQATVGASIMCQTN